MDAKFADRLARRIICTKRREGVTASSALVERVLGKKGMDQADPEYQQVLGRITFWKDKPCADDA